MWTVTTDEYYFWGWSLTTSQVTLGPSLFSFHAARSERLQHDDTHFASKTVEEQALSYIAGRNAKWYLKIPNNLCKPLL